jgi:hypothetical protein
MFGMQPPDNLTAADYDRTDMAKYGLGTRRPLSKFLAVFGVDFRARTVRDLCRAVQSGQLHADLLPYLRPDGIDYDRVPDSVGRDW